MKKFSIRTVEDLQAQLSNATTQEQLEAVFNSATLKVLRIHIDYLSGYDTRYKKATREFIIKILVDWRLERIAEDKEAEDFKKLSFEEQVSYLQSVSYQRQFIKLMDIAKMEEFIYEVYLEQAEKIENELSSFFSESTRKEAIFLWFERAIKKNAEDKEIEEFKSLSFEEQISYLQSENCKDYFITLMDYTKMKEFVCKVYPERVEQIENSEYIHLWFERAIGKSSGLENLSNYSYAADKRITKRNIQRIKQCESERELTELLSTGNQDTLAMIIDTLGIRGYSFTNCVEQLKKVI